MQLRVVVSDGSDVVVPIEPSTTAYAVCEEVRTMLSLLPCYNRLFYEGLLLEGARVVSGVEGVKDGAVLQLIIGDAGELGDAFDDARKRGRNLCRIEIHRTSGVLVVSPHVFPSDTIASFLNFVRQALGDPHLFITFWTKVNGNLRSLTPDRRLCDCLYVFFFFL